jgi:energy-coupling factor transporter ATP-binding protein EcfA2
MPLRRSTLLLVGAFGALGFVVLRMVYRIVFGGAGTGATVLPHLPAIRLGGPFSHIQLFGPITLEGLIQAALGAIPFALVILLTASAVAFIDTSKILLVAPRLAVGSRLVAALGIAFSTFPVVVNSVRQAKKTGALRGMKPGLRLFTPVLEKTLERAREIAVALETRGIVGDHSTPRLNTGEFLVACEDFFVADRMAGPVTLDLRPGQSVTLTGATGSGKTTLLEAIAGVLHQQGATPASGSLAVGFPAARCAYLPHDPESIFLTTSVRDDVALSLIARGVASHDAKNQATVLLEDLGISHLATKSPWMLSSGEAVMAGLAVVLVTKPEVVLLDEPLTALDAVNRDVFVTALAAYQARTSAAVVITHHPLDPHTLPGFTESVLTPEGLVPGRFVSGYTPTTRLTPLTADNYSDRDVVACVRDLSVVFDTTRVLNAISFDIHRGDVVVITGRNGVGKSSLIRALFDADPGSVSVRGRDLSTVSPHERARFFAVVPSSPADLFLTSSVVEELEWADRVAGVEKGFTRVTLESILPEPWHHDVLAASHLTHPRDLSRGQQAALAVAVQLSHKPVVVALDEPTRGLDASARQVFAEVVACVVETGTAVVLASHHEDSDGVTPTRRFVLADGRLKSHPVGVTP